jgi:hypothetical protein
MMKRVHKSEEIFTNDIKQQMGRLGLH